MIKPGASVNIHKMVFVGDSRSDACNEGVVVSRVENEGRMTFHFEKRLRARVAKHLDELLDIAPPRTRQVIQSVAAHLGDDKRPVLCVAKRGMTEAELSSSRPLYRTVGSDHPGVAHR